MIFTGRELTKPSQTPFAPDGRSNKYVEIGEGQAYFRHYHDRNDRCATSASFPDLFLAVMRPLILNTDAPIAWNLKSEYPNLHKVFDDPSTKKIFSCPTCVSLGPNGTYFAHLSGGTYWQVSSAIQDEIDMYEVDKMWLGRGSSYVAVFKSGRIQWNFRGKYPELEEKWLALSKSSSPKVSK